MDILAHDAYKFHENKSKTKQKFNIKHVAQLSNQDINGNIYHAYGVTAGHL